MESSDQDTGQSSGTRRVRSRSICNATDEVLKAAVNMERSDSFLFSDEEEEEDTDEDSFLHESQTLEPSVEALLSSSLGNTRIVHTAASSRRRMSDQSTRSSRRSSSVSSGDLGEVSKFLALDDHQAEPAIPPAAPLHQESAAPVTPMSPVEILESCGAMPMSLPHLLAVYQRGSPDREIASALTRARQHPRDDSEFVASSKGPLPQNEEAHMLHSIFVTFCSPPPSLKSVERILESEQNQNYETRVPLPKDALISVAGAQKASVISLLTHAPKTHLLRLPLAFQLAFFRILIRLLTNETDAEYNRECLFTCDWIEEEDLVGNGPPLPDDEQKVEIEKRRKVIHKLRQNLLHTNKAEKVARRPNQLYTVVRFRSGTAWKGRAVTSMLDLFHILQKGGDSSLLAPVTRLMGLCASAGIEVKELRSMLDLAGRPFPTAEQMPAIEPGLDRLLLIRALSTAAEGASQSSLLVGKASPRYFFNFGLGHGLARTFKQTSIWPFRNDFGMAVWFRAESLEFSHSRHYPKLLSVRTHDGGGIEVSLVPKQEKAGNGTLATVIAVSVFDSQANGKEASQVQQVKLEGCILLPRVWYHVAIRHTRSRLKGVFSLSSRQQVSIMLDGKLMLTESLKFPKISTAESPTESSSMLRNPLRRSFDSESGSTMTIQCGANFEGQTGAFYVFNDNVSDATLKALYDITGGTDGVIKRKSLTDTTWDERRGDIAHRSHALAVEITHADAEEIVLSSHENDIIAGRTRSGSAVIKTTAMVADMADGEGYLEESDLPAELSKLSLGSRLFLVWDPKRIEDPVALELHSGAHVRIDADKVQPWHVEGAKNVIASIGGVQALIPVFRAGLAGDIERHWSRLGDNGAKGNGEQSRLDKAKVYTMIPSLLTLLSSFLRDHGENAREMLRCGGIDIVEQLLQTNKALSEDMEEIKGKETLMTVVSVYPGLSRLLVASLLDVESACSHYTGLETTVFSRLLFNLNLWFAGATGMQGVALHAALFPIWSSLSKTSPRKVRDCVGVRPMVELLREYSNVDDKTSTNMSPGNQEAATDLFDRSRWSGLDRRAPLTIRERRHIVDIIFAMVCELLASGTLPFHLQPLLNYVSYNVDVEWEQASKDIKGGVGRFVRTGMRHERFLSTMKAATVLLCLLLARPVVPTLTDSFAKCCGGELGAAGWILCCLVNTFDDDMRSVGIRCLTAYLNQTAPAEDAMLTVDVSGQPNGADAHPMDRPAYTSLPANSMLSSSRFTNTISNVGKGLAAIGNGAGLSRIIPASKVSVKVVYKLLWHLLKCHRDRSDQRTHAALLLILLENSELLHSSILTMGDFVIKDATLLHGYRINMQAADISAFSLGSYSGEKLRQTPAINIILRLLRFLPPHWKEKWLRVFVAMSSATQFNVDILLSSSQWQPPLFHLVSDMAEEVATMSMSTHKAESSYQSSAELSFDLSFKLYANLLGHCFRHGGDQALQVLEQAASLQRICVNGHEVFTLILTHLLADLNGFGSPDPRVAPTREDTGERSKLLKQSARIVTNAIMSNSDAGFDATAAVKQWRCLRHLTAIATAVVTKSGYGVADLFDYRNQHASSLDGISGGIYGIRLSESDISGMTSRDYARLLSIGSQLKRDERDQLERDLYRQVCVSLSAQVLSLLDAFIFPDSLDASLPASQLHGLALVRSSEPRLGVSQGPILASVVRLSLVLMCHLEPSSVKFLQCCSRLRCFVHWILELIRESVSLAGYSAAFDELTAPLDRLVLAIVLQCHRALARCSAVLTELEASHFSVYFPNEEAQRKNYKRVLRVALELREIVLAAYRGRNEVLRAALSPKAFDALQSGLETNPSGSKEAVIRAFLSNDWVSNFHDVDRIGNVSVPVQITDGRDSIVAAASPKDGIKAIEALSAESEQIIADFNRALDIQFEAYCEDQRQWAETDAVRDLEYEGDNVVQRLSGKHRVDLAESARRLTVRADAVQSRLCSVERKTIELWNNPAHLKLAEHTDRLNRRILLVRNEHFNDHHDASYELMLNQERDKAIKDREERERRKQEEELSELVRRNSSAFVPYGDIQDVEDENMDEVDQLHVGKQLDGENGDVDVKDGDEGASSQGKAAREESMNSSEADIEKLDLEEELLDEEIQSIDGDAWAKTFIWSSSESVVARFENVSTVSLQTITEGRLLLTTHGLYFNRTGDVVSVMTKQSIDEGTTGLEPISLRWRLSRLTEVHGRRFMLRAQALELFFSDSHELFLNFSGGTRERDRFYAKLRNSCKVPLLWSPKSLNPRTAFKKSQLTQLWKKRKISNFQYLMQLNKMAGRTFNDITQYPVFPWVLCDYTSEEIDLNNSRVYRDLSKPVGALNPDRLSQLIERYNELASFGFAENERFLYGSHYSSPGVVLHYMLRQEPFTTMAIELQSGRFDCPDRLFFDVAGCWNSCMTSTSDVKELVPEFFTCPEMFLNTNHFPLGSTQGGRPIDNVGLPPWAKGSAYEFVRIHRLALESEHVSRNLHHWIDLIFGYKQRGPEAESAHNIFHYLSYEGAVDLDKITDDVDRIAAESHIQNFGQTPCQLLVKDPHPDRFSPSDSWQPLMYDISIPKHLRCHKPPKQFGGKHGGIARGAVACIHVMSEFIVVVYADMSLGSYKWYPNRSGGKHPFSIKMDKHRTIARRELSTSRAAIKRSSATPQSMDSSSSRYAVGNWSFGITLGGQVKENLRRKAALAPSRILPEADSISAAEASSLLVSCGYWDDTVKVHSVDGSRLLCSVNGGHRGPIRCLTIGNDGGLMITGGEDGTCRVWLVDHPDMAIALSDGYVQTALGASNDREQLLSCCHVLWGHETAVTCVALSSDLDVTVSGSLGGTICVHTVRRGHFIRSIQGKAAVRKIALDSHGTFVAHTEDSALHAYTINGVHLCSVDAKEHLHDMKISSNGELLVTGGDKGHVVIRTVRDLHILSMLDLSRHGPIRCISFTPEELNPIPQFLFIGSDDGLITIVDKDPLYAEEESFSKYESFEPEYKL